MIIILSGPPAAGKSTLANALAHQFHKSASFSLDTIRHFIKGGYIKPCHVLESKEQIILARQISFDITNRYLDEGYIVVIDDVIDDEGIKAYKEKFSDVQAFLLLPSLEVLKDRDKHRPFDDKMGNERIEQLYNEFTAKEFTELESIDSSEQSMEKTLEILKEKLSLVQKNA